MAKKSTEPCFLKVFPIFDSRGEKIGDVNVDFLLDKNSRSKGRAEFIEIYKEFLNDLKSFFDQAEARNRKIILFHPIPSSFLF